MTPLRVFVDAHPLDVASGATAIEAVRAFDPALAADVASGIRVITDSRGLPIPADTAVVGGSIFRVVRQRAHPTDQADGAT